VLGQEVFSQQKKMGDDGLVRMDLTGLPGGVYLCEVLSAKSGRRAIRLVRE
jgi:hypothetical protein